jgi:hypothetical protein
MMNESLNDHEEKTVSQTDKEINPLHALDTSKTTKENTIYLRVQSIFVSISKNYGF